MLCAFFFFFSFSFFGFVFLRAFLSYGVLLCVFIFIN